MKRIKAMNGYTIMQVTARDEKQGNGTAGEYSIFFSSDIRDYGVSNSTPEWDGIDSLEVALELVGAEDAHRYAIAKELCEQESTAVTFEDIETKLQEMEAEQDEGQGFTWSSDYFYGHKISDYGLEHGYVDYKTLASAFDAVLNNEIYGAGWNIGAGWELESGSDYDEETDSYSEVFQWYIVTDAGAEILKEFGEIVYYHSDLDMYIWGVTHWGTAWDYVLTDIKIVKEGN